MFLNISKKINIEPTFLIRECCIMTNNPYYNYNLTH